MKILSSEEFEEIRNWMYRNARPLEMALWKYLFEGGEKETFLQVLSCYQNKDGGFGKGVEPDCWNQESSPYAAQAVIRILRTAGILEKMESTNPILQGILRYLESGVYSDGEGWYFSIPSNDNYPRAPWWTFNEEQNRLQSMGITAGLCAFILSCGEKNSPIYKKAYEYTALILKKAASAEEFGEMGIGNISLLLEAVERNGLAGEIPCDGLAEWLREAANRSIERDPEKWQYYTSRPSDFIQSPDSPCYRGNEEIVEKELDYTLETRNPGGVWDITWSWFDLTEQYPEEFAVTKNWWKAWKAIEKVRFLKNFGRYNAE